MLTWLGNKHGIAASVDAHFHSVNVEFGHQILEIGEDAGGEGLATVFIEQCGTLEFAERRGKGKDVVLLPVAGVLLDGPVGYGEIGKSVCGAPTVVTAGVDGLIETDVD